MRHALLILALVITARPAAAQALVPDDVLPGDPPVIRAVPLLEEERISLDGLFTEAVWRRAVPAVDFYQVEPIEGGAPSERTEVRVAYDRDNLYIGAILYDSDPSGIRGHQRQRDAGLGSDDRFMWILDTFLDGRSGYFFEINPAGLMGDGLLRGSSVSKAWDGIWEARVVRDARGWSAEIRIPFRTLNFDPALDAWGINFQRTVRRKSEEIVWSGFRRNQGLFQLVSAGRLVGLEGISQGLGVEVRPYTAGSWRQVAGSPNSRHADVGVDLEYSITPSLRAAATVNTDFAEANVDQRQVNLTRFPISFPEQRQFFLEGASVYSFAPSSGVNPYFSRRIGLVEGVQIPIVYGARLGGTAGGFDLGLLQVRTARDGLIPAEDFTIGRLRRNVFRQSSVGAIYTRRSTDDLNVQAATRDRHTAGLDIDLATSTFLGNRNLGFEGFYVWHSDPAVGGSSPGRARSGHGARIAYPNDVWRGHVSFREFGEAWDPAVGFAPRRGFRRTQPTLTWSPRPDRWGAVRQFEFEARLEYLTDLTGRLETRKVDYRPFGVRLTAGDSISIDLTRQLERIDRPFRIYGAIDIPPGTYRFDYTEVRYSGASQRRVATNLSWQQGGFWNGQRTRYDAGVTLRPVTGVVLGTSWERNVVSLPAGDFTADLMRVDASWHLSPWASFSSNMQWDNVSELVGLYTRLRWIMRPGNDLYVVYTHNWQQSADSFATVSRGATSKLTYTHRF